ncbi:MAG: hypothetical protein R3C70_07035 [Geminicoccaceae bacterium]
MSSIARQAGISRETLYKAFSEGGNPTLGTLQSVLASLGYRLDLAAQAEAGG